MRNKPDNPLVFAGLGMLALLAGGLCYLFALRFSAGDIYPAYSSLRTDPLGTKAFYDGLNACGRVRAKRKYRPLVRSAPAPGSALFYLGLPVFAGEMAVSRAAVADMLRFMKRGGRIVVTMLPLRSASRRPRTLEMPEPEQQEADEPGDAEDTTTREDEKEGTPRGALKNIRDTRGFGSQWGFECRRVDRAAGAVATLTPGFAGGDLPKTISCRSDRVFDNLHEAWRPVYERDGRPVIVERRFGSGSLVVSTLTFFVSNEAMKNERLPTLLRWLVGARDTVLFDERHHGIHEPTGVARLARQYRLHGLALGILLLAGLFVWKNALSLVPPHRIELSGTANAVSAGRGTGAGLANLLRRNIAARELPAACLEEWQRAVRRPIPALAAKIDQMSKIAQAHRQARRAQVAPVDAYAAMQRVLEAEGESQ